ncbi:LacI family DNA-binding transcriptional regulator [Zooshikella marina]|uniref:LacI family DNA-binding transcriptional regulator n=1 Tax=Zooshikella ganghwensis TaxID=202772 RepID=UPI00041E51DF|nr:LacI family DNA-binding transcriptional regulator [Zooshikella ganghwensis]MBU2705949.1 LacI family DNA-binding transcriptional regulator [Zooshikella ganghwensis]
MKEKKRITLAEIAKKAGVSKSTVSFILNGKAEALRISETTRKKVLAIVEEYNYRPSIHARSLKSKRSYTIGLVIPDLTNLGFASIAKELEKHCREDGLQLLIACSEDDQSLEKKVVTHLVERQVDALIVGSAMTNDQFYIKLTNQLPVIQLDRQIGNSSLPLVCSDACNATADVVTKLISNTRQECYFFGGQLELSPSKQRLDGYKLGLKRASLILRPGWIKHADYQPQSGYKMMDECIKELGRPPYSLFTASYTILEGVLRYLRDHQLLDFDIRIATFDDYHILDCLPIDIDSVAQDCTSLAYTAYTITKNLLDGKETSQTQFTIPAKICWRSR